MTGQPVVRYWPYPATVAEVRAMVADHQPIDPDAEVTLCRRCSGRAGRPRRWECHVHHAAAAALTKYGLPLVADPEPGPETEPACTQG